MESVQGPQGHDDDWLDDDLQSQEWDESNGKLGVRNVCCICVSGL